MVVQHNLTAMNSNRMLGITQGLQAKSSEKLSSGYRINRAADDAAGLSISEKMRKQINGLDQASTNAEDGVSAVQTAEGALTEVHSMLQRMNELAVQAANGTNSLSDREAIQSEIEQLTTEIDRVAETTKFNETYLLKGAASGESKTQTVAAHDAGLAGKLVANNDGTSSFALNDKLENGDKITIAGKEYTIGEAKTTQNYISLNATSGKGVNATDYTLAVGDSFTISGNTYTVTSDVAMKDLNNLLADGDTITTKEGKVYTKDANAKLKDGTSTTWKDSNGEGIEQILIDEILATEGNVLYDKSNNKEHTIVAALEAGEISTAGKTSAQLAATTLATTDAGTAGFANGDSVIRNGKEVTVVDENFAADTFSNIKDGIMAAAAGTYVQISDIEGQNTVTYLLVENAEDEDLDKAGTLGKTTAKRITRENVIALLKEGDQVAYAKSNQAGWDANGDPTMTDMTNAKKSTVAGVDEVAEGSITKTQAYGMMAEELTKASSIGTDTAAKVTNNNDGTFDIKQGTVEVKESLNFNLQVGADADMTNKITVDVEAMSAAGLGIKGINVADDTGVSATYAIDAIADAVAKVSEQRSALGAIQNRLEHTIANLDNVVENTTAAESRIRDTDMAEEMVQYSKNNILAQAGQSMLAQANSSTQGVLSLLG